MNLSSSNYWHSILSKLFTRLSRKVVIKRFVSAMSSKPAIETLRIMYIANSFIPTLQLSFVKPLQTLVDRGEIEAELLSEQQLKDLFGKSLKNEYAKNWVQKRLQNFKPDILLFCRYSGPHVELMLDFAKKYNVATIFHIDDDLLNVPLEIGRTKYDFHNNPARLKTISTLIDHATMVYCSTNKLLQRLRERGLDQRGLAGHIYCSGEVLAPAPIIEPLKIGYMGFDHAYDFQIALPGLIQILIKYPYIEFELFGSIPKPIELEQFGSRVTVIDPIIDYQQFMDKFSSLGWAIGICPLANTSFNAVKANTKWVEYTSIGAAVIATAGTVYDECCSQDCGILVADKKDWYTSLESLINDSTMRLNLVARAQARLQSDYSTDALQQQVMSILKQVRSMI